MPILAYMLTRFSEPSSYAGLGALLALIGWNLPDTIAGQLAHCSPPAAASSRCF
jgi:hypothetical protein